MVISGLQTPKPRALDALSSRKLGLAHFSTCLTGYINDDSPEDLGVPNFQTHPLCQVLDLNRFEDEFPTRRSHFWVPSLSQILPLPHDQHLEGAVPRVCADFQELHPDRDAGASGFVDLQKRVGLGIRWDDLKVRGEWLLEIASSYYDVRHGDLQILGIRLGEDWPS